MRMRLWIRGLLLKRLLTKEAEFGVKGRTLGRNGRRRRGSHPAHPVRKFRRLILRLANARNHFCKRDPRFELFTGLLLLRLLLTEIQIPKSIINQHVLYSML